MLVAIIGLVLTHQHATGVFTFNYLDLLNTPMSKGVQWLLMLGFFIAFAVKMPLVPLHGWLPDAHSQAPTAGSVDLAGILLKTAAYGLLRFALPLFPEASAEFAPYAMVLGLIGIVYGAIVAFAQTDIKRLVAYTSRQLWRVRPAARARRLYRAGGRDLFLPAATDVGGGLGQRAQPQRLSLESPRLAAG